MKQKFTWLLLLTAIACQDAFTQPRIRSQKVFGGSLYDGLTCMDLTSDGGFILGGHSESNRSGNKTENSRGVFDYWVIKLDSSGKIQWDKTIGGNSSDALYSLQQTSDGGYILGGWSSSNKSGEKSENNRCGCKELQNSDYWVVKLDSQGNIQWDKTIGGNEYEELTSLYQTADGGYILGGHSASDKSGEKSENNNGVENYWIVKLDNKGNIEWDKTIGGSQSDYLSSLQQTDDGGYILGGSSTSHKSGDKTEDSRGIVDCWIVKLDNKGNVQWDKTIGGNDMNEVKSLQQTSDGGYILGGRSTSNKSGEKTENSRGGWDYWVIKLNGIGKIQWDKTIGGSEADYLSFIQETSDDGYVLAGISTSNQSGEKTENSKGGEDYWVVKLNSSGNIQWDKTIGGNDPDWAYSIKEFDKDRYLAGGVSKSGISGDKKKRSRGNFDYWIVALDDRGISNTITASPNPQSLVLPNVANKKGFSIYPNPAKDMLNIHINSTATFSLTNQAGKILLTKTIAGKGEINVAELPAGLYYLKNNETSVVQKVLVGK